MMHDMHLALASGAAIQHSHNVTPFLHYILFGQDGRQTLYKMILCQALDGE